MRSLLRGERSVSHATTLAFNGHLKGPEDTGYGIRTVLLYRTPLPLPFQHRNSLFVLVSYPSAFDDAVIIASIAHPTRKIDFLTYWCFPWAKTLAVCCKWVLGPEPVINAPARYSPRLCRHRTRKGTPLSPPKGFDFQARKSILILNRF
jgi:hypothetical protein